MKNKVDQLAEEYADKHMEKFDLKSVDLPYHHNDRNKLEDAFESGYRAKELEIRKLQQKLITLRGSIAVKTLTEQMLSTRELNVINSKIDVLEELI